MGGNREDEKKSILVTGGAGYIGSHTVLQLLLGGYRVVVVDNLVNSSEEAVKRVAELAGEYAGNLTFHQVDLRDKEAVEKVFSSDKVPRDTKIVTSVTIPSACSLGFHKGCDLMLHMVHGLGGRDGNMFRLFGRLFHGGHNQSQREALEGIIEIVRRHNPSESFPGVSQRLGLVIYVFRKLERLQKVRVSAFQEAGEPKDREIELAAAARELRKLKAIYEALEREPVLGSSSEEKKSCGKLMEEEILIGEDIEEQNLFLKKGDGNGEKVELHCGRPSTVVSSSSKRLRNLERFKLDKHQAQREDETLFKKIRLGRSMLLRPCARRYCRRGKETAAEAGHSGV
ncbi:hypothetical protein KI387_027705 [Taxus chinensis]|uniref:UDP-glucose 4-epimerase n=1 Tax=Taxus chinensis TaxID=29808 RepID=A0AA38FYC6_TAXCH|nr:hypothetical protein KI387_027705 [Taxus chinensis]